MMNHHKLNLKDKLSKIHEEFKQNNVKINDTLSFVNTVVPLYSHPLYKHTLYIFTLVLGPVFYIVKCPLYCHKLIIVTITVIHGPNIIITYENFTIYSHISLLRKYIMSFESKILSFAVVSRSAPILIWK